MEIKNTLQNHLKGQTLTNALDIVDYMIGKGLTPQTEWSHGFRFVKNDKSPCLLFIIDSTNEENGEWVMCDVPVVNEAGWDALPDDLKDFVRANIKTCNVYEGNPCGCGSEPGATKTIFGKAYDNVCTSEIQFVNPDAAMLDMYKKLIDWWATNIA